MNERELKKFLDFSKGFKMGYFQEQHKARSTHQLILDAHYAMISTFHNGNPESYINYYQQKITKLKSLGEPTWVDLKVKEYEDIINFVIAYISRKIKWK